MRLSWNWRHIDSAGIDRGLAFLHMSLGPYPGRVNYGSYPTLDACIADPVESAVVCNDVAVADAAVVVAVVAAQDMVHTATADWHTSRPDRSWFDCRTAFRQGADVPKIATGLVVMRGKSSSSDQACERASS